MRVMKDIVRGPDLQLVLLGAGKLAQIESNDLRPERRGKVRHTLRCRQKALLLGVSEAGAVCYCNVPERWPGDLGEGWLR